MHLTLFSLSIDVTYQVIKIKRRREGMNEIYAGNYLGSNFLQLVRWLCSIEHT